MSSTPIPEKLEFEIDLPQDKLSPLLDGLKDFGRAVGLDALDTSLTNKQLSMRTRQGTFPIEIRLQPAAGGKTMLEVRRLQSDPAGDRLMQELNAMLPAMLAGVGRRLIG